MTNRMKTRLIAIFAFVAAVAIPAFGATTGSLALSGSVPAILEITVTATAAASALPITTTVTDVTVATVVERSNKKDGYTVKLQSANIGLLKSPDGTNLDTLAYTLKYDGAAVSLAASPTTISDISAKTSSAGSSKPLTISFDGASSFLNEGSYADTLTFTIEAR